jgi:hypothetical protein
MKLFTEAMQVLAKGCITNAMLITRMCVLAWLLLPCLAAGELTSLQRQQQPGQQQGQQQ